MKLTKKFFKENPLPKVNAAELAQAEFVLNANDDIDSMLNEVAGNSINTERKAKIEKEKELIKSAQTADDFISIMRKYGDPFNRGALCHAVADRGDEIVSEVLRYYYRNLIDSFLEIAAMILYMSDKKYISELYKNYKNIRSPYGQALACLLFRFAKTDELDKLVDFLYNEYHRFMEDYTTEPFYEFPLLAMRNIFEESEFERK